MKQISEPVIVTNHLHGEEVPEWVAANTVWVETTINTRDHSGVNTSVEKSDN